MPVRGGGLVAIGEESIWQRRQFDAFVDGGHPLLMVQAKHLFALSIVQDQGQHSDPDPHDDGDNGNEQRDNWKQFVHKMTWYFGIVCAFQCREPRFRWPPIMWTPGRVK